MNFTAFQIQNITSKLQQTARQLQEVIQSTQQKIQLQKQQSFTNRFQIQQMQPVQVIQEMQRTSVLILDDLIQRAQQTQKQLLTVNQKIDQAIHASQVIQQKQAKLGSQTIQQVQAATEQIQKVDKMAQVAIQKIDKLLIEEQKYVWNAKEAATTLMIHQSPNQQIQSSQIMVDSKETPVSNFKQYPKMNQMIGKPQKSEHSKKLQQIFKNIYG